MNPKNELLRGLWIEKKSFQRVPLPITIHVVATAAGTDRTHTERFQNRLFTRKGSPRSFGPTVLL